MQRSLLYWAYTRLVWVLDRRAHAQTATQPHVQSSTGSPRPDSHATGRPVEHWTAHTGQPGGRTATQLYVQSSTQTNTRYKLSPHHSMKVIICISTRDFTKYNFVKSFVNRSTAIISYGYDRLYAYWTIPFSHITLVWMLKNAALHGSVCDY